MSLRPSAWMRWSDSVGNGCNAPSDQRYRRGCHTRKAACCPTSSRIPSMREAILLPEKKTNWVTARRAILRKPIDRIGYGGYLKLANEFPIMVDYVESVCAEFRELYSQYQGHYALLH